MSENTRKGRLFLVPTPLDFGCTTDAPLTDVLPAHTVQAAARITHWVCENAKSCRAFLKRVDAVAPLAVPLQQQAIQELPREAHKKGDHLPQTTSGADASMLIAAALQGHDIGLVSEAGMPAIADPGSSVVRAAHDAGVEVVPLVGPTSLLLALAASGLNGQNFAFVGYVPSDGAQRVARLRELEQLALRQGQTQIFIETPYRNPALMSALLQTLQANTRLSISGGLTLESARTQSRLVKQWKALNPELDNRTPMVFAIGR
ncbi:16S rRNA (cytidine1402-2'-O)-methyltransferase [Comamonas odontotermitis]|uniref:16S rRNA (Cytidine1402-2'-O)-methyltransferase n=1 Tax=Comamonas odontotermitis TaxID=379895 RepID=A0ABR6RF66_9BURK|nr:SAM-dependent methyltransferase [Comamonas odontotermitis]MBB6577796.1 16S rRNA (cytidine1402-2'-O)-methyltransferase [Comamonas odontotermitis]